MKLARVNLKSCQAGRENLPEEARELGGRGLIAYLLTKLGDPKCDPLSPQSKLIFANGLLSNLGLSGCERLSVGAKSPLTGGIKESNAGGTFGLYLARLGFRALVLEDGLPEWGILVIRPTGIGFVPAGDLAGLGTRATVEGLRSRFPDMTSAALIGPAGERKLAAAAIAVTDIDGEPNRFAGRGGLGAVMGAKKIKAIVLGKGDHRQQPVDAEGFTQLRSQYHQALIKHPTTGEWFSKYGTTGMVSIVNALGGLPVRNFTLGQTEQADLVSGEALSALISQRGGEGRVGHPCIPGCVVRCSNTFPDAAGKAVVAPLEYETIGMLGINLGIFDLDAIADFNRICNDMGLDTIEVGGALGVAMEAGFGSFGNTGDARSLLSNIVDDTLLGKILGSGADSAGKVLGCRRVPAVKGQTISAYDPRGVKGTGVTYATTPMGGDHTTGLTVFAQMDHHAREGQLAASRTSQINRTAADTLGLCSFHLPAVFNLLPDLLQAASGTSCGPEYVQQLALKTIKMEIQFNHRAGISAGANRLPAFFRTEALPPFNFVFDLEEEDLVRFWE